MTWANSRGYREAWGRKKLQEELKHTVQRVETQRRQVSGITPDGAGILEVFPDTLNGC